MGPRNIYEPDEGKNGEFEDSEFLYNKLGGMACICVAMRINEARQDAQLGYMPLLVFFPYISLMLGNFGLLMSNSMTQNSCVPLG